MVDLPQEPDCFASLKADMGGQEPSVALATAHALDTIKSLAEKGVLDADTISAFAKGVEHKAYAAGKIGAMTPSVSAAFDTADVLKVMTNLANGNVSPVHITDAKIFLEDGLVHPSILDPFKDLLAKAEAGDIDPFLGINTLPGKMSKALNSVSSSSLSDLQAAPNTLKQYAIKLQEAIEEKQAASGTPVPKLYSGAVNAIDKMAQLASPEVDGNVVAKAKELQMTGLMPTKLKTKFAELLDAAEAKLETATPEEFAEFMKTVKPYKQQAQEDLLKQLFVTEDPSIQQLHDYIITSGEQPLPIPHDTTVTQGLKNQVSAIWGQEPYFPKIEVTDDGPASYKLFKEFGTDTPSVKQMQDWAIAKKPELDWWSSDVTEDVLKNKIVEALTEGTLPSQNAGTAVPAALSQAKKNQILDQALDTVFPTINELDAYLKHNVDANIHWMSLTNSQMEEAVIAHATNDAVVLNTMTEAANGATATIASSSPTVPVGKGWLGKPVELTNKEIEDVIDTLVNSPGPGLKKPLQQVFGVDGNAKANKLYDLGMTISKSQPGTTKQGFIDYLKSIKPVKKIWALPKPPFQPGTQQLTWLSAKELNALIKPHGGIYLGPMGSENKVQWLKHFYNGDLDKVYQIELKAAKGKHKLALTHPGSPDNPANAGGFIKKAMGSWFEEITPVSEAVPLDKYPTLAKYTEDVKVNQFTGNFAIDADEARKFVAEIGFEEADLISDQTVKEIASAHIKGDQFTVDKGVAKGKQLAAQGGGEYNSPFYKKSVGGATPSYTGSASYTPPPPPVPKAPSWTLMQPQPSYAGQGMHTKYAYRDQDGNEWLFKPAKSEPFRAESEHAAHEVGRLLGYNTADSQIVTLPDRGYGQMQRIYENLGGLKGVPASTLTERQAKDVAEEHILDWVLSNHDTHPENIIRLANGRAVGIDKGQAWKFFGTDKLEIGYLPPGNPVPVYYDHLYKAIIDGSIPKETADKIYLDVISKSRRVAHASDDKLRALLEKAFEKRTYYDATTANTGEELINQVLSRKSNVEQDFTGLWEKIYQQAGYDLPPIPDVLPTIHDGQVYSGLSQDLLDHVDQVGSSGVATLFDSSDLEGGAEFFWTEMQDGKKVLRAELKLNADADSRVMAWLKSLGVDIAKPLSGATGNPFKDASAEFFQKSVQLAKTVNVHSADGAYNGATVQTAKQLLGKIESDLSGIEKAVQSGKIHNLPLSSSSGVVFQTEAEQEAWTDMLKTYKVQFDTTLKAMDQQIKAPLVEKFSGDFNPIATVTPKKIDYKVLQEVPFPIGTYDHETGLSSIATSKAPKTVSGRLIEVKLDESTTLTYAPWDSHRVSHQGRLRVTFKDWDGSTAPIENLHSSLANGAAIHLEVATEESTELLYWRQMLNAPRAYKDAAKFKKPIEAYDALKAAGEIAKMPPEEETAWIKEQLSKIYPKDKLDKANPIPQFKHSSILNPDLITGRPGYDRFDLTDADIHASGVKFPASRLTGQVGTSNIVQSGGMLSTEERLRQLRLWVSGTMSAEADMKTGGSNFIFTRLRQNLDVYYNPSSLRRISSFSFPADNFGNVSHRATEAFWENIRALSDGSFAHKSTNETGLRDVMTVLDDIEVMVVSDSERNTIIGFLHKNGVKEIRGLSIEDRFVTSHQKGTAIAKAYAKWLERAGIK